MGFPGLLWRELLAKLAKICVMFISVYTIAYLIEQIPWEISVTIYIAGAIMTHIALFKGMAGSSGMTDFGAYLEDSGIFLIVFFWPAFFLFVLAPSAAEYLVRRFLGIARKDENSV